MAEAFPACFPELKRNPRKPAHPSAARCKRALFPEAYRRLEQFWKVESNLSSKKKQSLSQPRKSALCQLAIAPLPVPPPSSSNPPPSVFDEMKRHAHRRGRRGRESSAHSPIPPHATTKLLLYNFKLKQQMMYDEKQMMRKYLIFYSRAKKMDMTSENERMCVSVSRTISM